MRLFQIVMLLSLVLSANKVSACLDAYQHRVFPLGMCHQGLMVLELEMQRHEAKGTSMEKMVTAWSGKSYLRIYNKKNERVSSEDINLKLELIGSTYVKDLKATFAEAKKRANYLKSFQPIEFEEISFYHYEKSDDFELEVDTNSTQLFLTSDQLVKVELPILSEKCLFSKTYIKRSTRYGTDEGLNRETYNNILRWIDISSFRTYKIGEETITVIHMGSGQRLESWDGVYHPNTAEVPVEGQLFNEPTLHHGQGFDYLIWH